MKALVIFDSVFGNTEQIARAMGKGLSLENGTRVSRVSEVKPEDLRGLELLIAGSPPRGALGPRLPSSAC
jgi:flavodoxin